MSRFQCTAEACSRRVAFLEATVGFITRDTRLAALVLLDGSAVAAFVCDRVLRAGALALTTALAAACRFFLLRLRLGSGLLLIVGIVC